jgi:hypothetical protein
MFIREEKVLLDGTVGGGAREADEEGGCCRCYTRLATLVECTKALSSERFLLSNGFSGHSPSRGSKANVTPVLIVRLPPELNIFSSSPCYILSTSAPRLTALFLRRSRIHELTHICYSRSNDHLCVLWSILLSASLLLHSTPVLFTSLPLLLTICSYLSLVRLRALVLPLYIISGMLQRSSVISSLYLGVIPAESGPL